jgi:histidyl-tRNA synthetase
LRLERNLDGGSLKSQLKRADRSGAELALIIADDELANDTVGVKPLRDQREQQQLDHDALLARLAALIHPAGTE